MENEVQFSKPIMIQNLLKPAQKVKNESKTERKGIVKVKNENNSENPKNKNKAEYNKLAPSEADLNTNVNPNEISNIIINTNATQVSLLQNLNKYDQIDNTIKSNFVPQNNNLRIS